MRKIFFMFFLLVFLSHANAVPANPEPIFINSDNKVIKAKLVGDEKGYRIETEDSNIVSRMGGEKKIQYNKAIASRRNLAPSRIQQSKTTGERKAIIILISFPDTQPTNPPSYYQNLVFNASANSLNNYLDEVSYSKLSLNGTATRWYNASQNKGYYGGDVTGVDTNEDRADPGTWYVESLAREAVLLADADVDFSKYDSDNDGTVDHIIIVQAGRDQASTGADEDIWSHSSDIITYDSMIKKFVRGVSVDGVKAINYVMVSGYDPMGVTAHEFGHDLGLIDLYNTTSGASVVEEWDIMDSGAWNDHGSTPSHFSAWNKGLLGWLNFTSIIYPQTQTVPQIETFPVAFRINASPSEYFLVENRQLTGYDNFLPKAGILIWHIDDARGNNSGIIKKVNLVDASNGAVPLLRGAPFAGNYGYTSFTPFTSPSSSLNNGSPSGVKIYDIGSSGAFMNLTFGFHRATLRAGVGSNYTRIQDAVNVSQDGDIILLEAGDYFENIIINREITIKPASQAQVTLYPADSNHPTISIFSNNVSVSDLDIKGSSVGIYSYNTSNVTISGARILQGEYGIVLESVTKARLAEDVVYSNNRTGIWLIGSNNNTIEGINGSANENGIVAFSSSSNRFLRNSLKFNKHNGLELNISGNNVIGDNIIHDNHDSGIFSLSGANNTITNNDIRNNNEGLKLISENSSRIYQNNFINNSLNAFDDGFDAWDLGQIIGGNHYSDYTGSDAEGDGRGNIPYNISILLKDSYPFIAPYGWISRGDTNGNGVVDVVDALFIAQYTVGIRTLSASQLAAADVSGDGQVNIVDALFVAQYTVGLRQL